MLTTTYARTCLLLILAAFLGMVMPSGKAFAAEGYRCPPTAEDELGPLYKPDAPVRQVVGKGYLLFGRVQSAVDCAPIINAMIEVWLAGPDGYYDEDFRATLFSSEGGTYYFRSHVPPRYGLGRPHIHVKVTAPGFEPLVTQHYPRPGAGEAVFDLNLRPSGEDSTSGK